ncbi:MAG: apolipoprotein N-acyltransferase [Desulfonatronovibrio sp.]
MKRTDFIHFVSRLTGILSAGLLVWLCLPSGPWPGLPFVALVPFILALQGTKPLAGMFWGWAGGALFWLVSAFWIFHPLQNLMGLSGPLAILGTLMFVLVQGFPYALFGLFCGVQQAWGRPAGPVFQAALLTLLVFIFPAPCPGTPALSLYSLPLAIQSADIGGYALVDFFFLLVNMLLAYVLLSVHRRRQCLLYLVSAVLVLSVFLGYGVMRLNHFQDLEQNALKNALDNEFLSVRTIQPNIPVKGIFTEGLSNQYKGALGVMRMMTETSAADFGPVDLILWPEVSRIIYCNSDVLENQTMERTGRLVKAPIIVACLEKAIKPGSKKLKNDSNRPDVPILKQKHGPRYSYNTFALVDGDQSRIVYRKHKLIPFAEAAPLRETWPWFFKKMAKPTEYIAGPGPEVLSLTTDNGLNLKVQPLICFECGFPEMTRAGAALAARAFINVSNDAWFTSARAAELHLALALFRAVEQRRPLVRGTNSGFGAHIKASGEIVPGSLTPMNKRAVRQADLHLPDEITFYQRMGNTWLWLVGLFILGRFGQVFRSWIKFRHL